MLASAVSHLWVPVISMGSVSIHMSQARVIRKVLLVLNRQVESFSIPTSPQNRMKKSTKPNLSPSLWRGTEQNRCFCFPFFMSSIWNVWKYSTSKYTETCFWIHMNMWSTHTCCLKILIYWSRLRVSHWIPWDQNFVNYICLQFNSRRLIQFCAICSTSFFSELIKVCFLKSYHTSV